MSDNEQLKKLFEAKCPQCGMLIDGIEIYKDGYDKRTLHKYCWSEEKMVYGQYRSVSKVGYKRCQLTDIELGELIKSINDQ